MILSKNNEQDNIFSLSTAYQKSAIGLIRISGDDEIFSKIGDIFTNKSIIDGDGARVYYGYIKYNDEIIDEVLITKFIAPKSYTGQNMLEINIHGSIGVIDELSNILLNLGFRQSLKGEFSKRAFLNGKANLSKLEAINSLINSENTRQRDLSVMGLTGEIENYLNGVKNKILKIVGVLTVSIDYPEEEIIQDTDIDTEDIKYIINSLEKIIRNFEIKTVYQNGIKVVIAGKVNSGKSSFFNQILKFNRSIVSPKAGTTTDYVEYPIEYNGVKIILYDTAGLRKTDNEIEHMGIKNSYSVIENSDIVLYMIDGTVGISQEDEDTIKSIESKNINIIKVLSKSDLDEFKKIDGALSISNVNQNGIYDVFDNIVKFYPEIEKEYITPISQRQLRLFKECKGYLEKSLEYIQANTEHEFILAEIQNSLNCIGMITGAISTDDILDEVFNNFCVGK